MRILVVSDTHGDYFTLQRVVTAQPKAEIVIHLGDGEQQSMQLVTDFPEKMIVRLRGNGDWGSDLPAVQTLHIAGKKIFATHGHLYNGKMGYYSVYMAAREQKADILLFGHTHNAMTDYDDGLYVMNPGSLRGAYATYGILDITEAGIVTNIVKCPF